MSDKEEKRFKELQKHYGKLVEDIARKYFAFFKKPNCELDDYIVEGYLGLVKADKTFDPNREIEFVTFAYSHIRGQIRKYARNQNPVHIPAHIQAKMYAAEKALHRAQTQGLTLSDDELFAQSELRCDEFMALKSLQPQSLDAPLTNSRNEEGFTLAAIIADPNPAHQPELAMTNSCFKNEKFEQAIKRIYHEATEKQKTGLEIIASGLDIDEAAEQFKITPNKVRYYKTNAVENARRNVSHEEVFSRGR